MEVFFIAPDVVEFLTDGVYGAFTHSLDVSATTCYMPYLLGLPNISAHPSDADFIYTAFLPFYQVFKLY